MTIVTFCDKCEKQIEDLRFNFFEIEEVPHYVISRGKCGLFIMCRKCNKEFEKWLKGKG